MHIELLLLGKTRRKEIRALLDDYAERIGRFAEINVRELREDSPAAMRRLELAPGATVVLLDAGGKKFDSQQFAAWLGGCRDHGVRRLVFLCGAAEAFPSADAARHGAPVAFAPDVFARTCARHARRAALPRLCNIVRTPYPK